VLAGKMIILQPNYVCIIPDKPREGS
jgi:hypothetical protein